MVVEIMPQIWLLVKQHSKYLFHIANFKSSRGEISYPLVNGASRESYFGFINIRQDWATNTEEKHITGVLVWDLSAAFDTLDVELLCKKLELYGLDTLSVSWFRSFLTNRSQKVEIGEAISNSVNLSSGVPQVHHSIGDMELSFLDLTLQWCI